MLVVEAKLKGKNEQFELLDEAIRTARFVQNSCLRYWMDNRGTSRNDLYKYCKVLADNPDFPWAKQLNSQARQASAERAWSAIARFFDNCKKQIPAWIEYFGKVFGVATVAVAPHYTSQNCSNCGETVKKSLSTRTHVCGHCGHIQDRDYNAAVNILKKGLSTVGHTGIHTWGENDRYLNQLPDSDKLAC